MSPVHTQDRRPTFERDQGLEACRGVLARRREGGRGNLAAALGSVILGTFAMALLHKPLVDGIRAIAVYEAAKGLLVLLAGFGRPLG